MVWGFGTFVIDPASSFHLSGWDEAAEFCSRLNKILGWDDFGAASVRLLSEATIAPLKERWYSGVPRYAVPSFDRLPASVSVLGRNSGSGLVSYGVARSAAPSIVQPVLYGMFFWEAVYDSEESNLYSAVDFPWFRAWPVRLGLRNNEFRVFEGFESHNPTFKITSQMTNPRNVSEG